MSNEIKLVGNISTDIEFTSFGEGKSRASFQIATTDKWKDKVSGEDKSQTDFHDVVCWNKTAEYVNQELKKGSFIELGGKLRSNRKHETEGKTYYNTYVEPLSVKRLEKKQAAANAPAEAKGPKM